MQVKFAGKSADVDWVHVTQIGLGVLSVVLVQVSQMPTLPADVVSGLALAATVIGLLYRSIFHKDPPKPPDGISSREETDPAKITNILRRIMTKFREPNPRWRLCAKFLQSGKSVTGFTVAVCLLPLVATLTFLGCPPPSGTVVAPTIATAVCILTTVSADVAAGDAWQQCVADAIAKCSTDVATISTVWASHERALVTEGFTPPAIRGRTP